MTKVRQDTPEKKPTAQELLLNNLFKATAASKELGEVQAAYMAGQIDGMLNSRLLAKQQSA